MLSHLALFRCCTGRRKRPHIEMVEDGHLLPQIPAREETVEAGLVHLLQILKGEEHWNLGQPRPKCGQCREVAVWGARDDSW